MDVLHGICVNINKFYKCRRIVIEYDNCSTSFTFDCAHDNRKVNCLEIVGLRRNEYVCMGKIINGDKIICVHENSVNGKIIVPVEDTFDFGLFTLKNKITDAVIKLNVYINETN
ncbi:hypothetical protein QKT50_gp046 [Rachiplusia ou multiple nucleopolyhedrovirus]|uniref:Uncharacterized protein n=1 Tax=Rachiplusia ou multiple nucleopolyhedrovirus (strain R1) TaxID=654904 RepID=Q8B9K2_NPVR1|nr:hypothetical protein QKT50_gp046 [Rachiplusia ou multiple nucleopolyhedrovirus]AAN28131.1 unknown [Rachiplusia ou multiple nucleopolyhedrovirus]